MNTMQLYPGEVLVKPLGKSFDTKNSENWDRS